MRRMVFVVVLAGFAATGCATRGGVVRLGPSPQYPLEQVMESNSTMICSISGDVFVGSPVNRCLQDLFRMGHRFSGSQLMGMPMFIGGSQGPSLGTFKKVALIAACSAGGYVGGWKGVAISGGCAAVIMALSSHGTPNQQTTATNPNVRIASDGTPIAVGRSPAQQTSVWGVGSPFGGRPNCLQQGLVTFRNLTGEILGVFEEGADPENEEPLAVLQPRGVPHCGDPDLRYEGWVRQTAISANRWVGGTQRIPRRPEARPGLVLVWR